MRKEWEEAVRRGDCEPVRRLVGEGADLDSEDRYGQTALMIASMRGCPDLVRLLVQSGAKFDTTAKYNLSALMLAVINGHTEIVRILTEAGADLKLRGTGPVGFAGKTALELAEQAGRDEIVQVLHDAADT